MRHNGIQKQNHSRMAVAALILPLFMTFNTASAAPEPQTVTGTITPDSSISVSGRGFGSNGPNIVIFEDFESGLPGQVVSQNSPVIGTWTSVGSNAEIMPDGRNGSQAVLAYDGSTHNNLRATLPGKQREIFISYWVRVPSGSRFPGSTSGPRQFSSDSSWKFAWIMDTTEGYRGTNDLYDLVVPTHTGNGQFQIAGNTYLPGDRYIGNSWWSWDNWMRISVHIQDPLRVSPQGYGTFETLSRDKGYSRRTFDASNSQIPYRNHQFDIVNVPSWIRSDSGSSVRPLYDDIYISVGEGAAARVELANAPRYENATEIELLLVEGWNDSSITATVPSSVNIDSGEGWYVFVTRADGSRNARGLSLCEACPQPPELFVE